MIIRNFKYSGDEKFGEHAVANLISEDGKDWYRSQALFDAEKLKFEFDEKGVIRRFSYDVSMLWPVDKSVAQIGADKVPASLNESGEWVFNGTEIIRAERDYIVEAEGQRQLLLQDAATAIAPLQDAADLGIATDEETSRLMEWRRYRVLLSRVDVNNAPDIEWPEVPDNVA